MYIYQPGKHVILMHAIACCKQQTLSCTKPHKNKLHLWSYLSKLN